MSSVKTSYERETMPLNHVKVGQYYVDSHYFNRAIFPGNCHTYTVTSLLLFNDFFACQLPFAGDGKIGAPASNPSDLIRPTIRQRLQLLLSIWPCLLQED